MLDLYTAIHNDRKSAILRDAPALRVDYRELTPEIFSTDRNSLLRDCGHRCGRAEDVDDVHGNWHVLQAGEASLTENLGLAWIHWHNTVSMPLQVEPDEIARAQVVARQPNDRDGLCTEQRRLDRQWILIAHKVKPIHCPSLAGPDARARANPCSRSQIRSSVFSMPTESRIVPGRTPAAASSRSSSCRCVVLAGWMTRLFASPTFARCDHKVRQRINSCPASLPPRISNENTAPAPRGRYFWTSARYGLLGKPGYVMLQASSCDSR